jgi:hypothetical protein
MNRISSMLHFRPWLAPAFLLGVLTGVTLVWALKVLAFTQDGMANIVGSGLGAAIAVVGSAWVANRADRRKERASLRAISDAVRTTEPKVDALLRAISNLGEQSNDAEREAVISHASAMIDASNLMLNRVTGLEPVFLSLGAWGVTNWLELLRRIPHLTDLAGQAKYIGTYPATADESKRRRLAAQLRNEASAILGVVGLSLDKA